MLRIGVVFPQLEIGNDPVRIREYAVTVEQLGFKHIVAFDHVLGADADRPGGWSGPYSHRDAFHEPFVLLGHLAAVTSSLELVTGVIVLPQRPTALVAKQAAAVDVISGGRLRLGVGVGWNAVEYEALGESFHDRARRIEEQIEVLRLLWTRDVVDYAGHWHRIDRAGINPLPIQRPIPLWLGGSAEPALRRAARLADGWMRGSVPLAWKTQIATDQVRDDLQRFRAYVREAGRDPSQVGIQVRMNASAGRAEDWATTAQALGELGATHLEFNTMGAGLQSADEHLAAIRRFRAALSTLGLL